MTEEAAKTVRTRFQNPVPTDKIGAPKQLEVVRAYGTLYNANGQRPVDGDAVGTAVEMSGKTINMLIPFLAGVGLLKRENGGCIPSPEARDFAKAKGDPGSR